MPTSVPQGSKGVKVPGYRPELSLTDLLLNYSRGDASSGEEGGDDGEGRGTTQRGLVVVDPSDEWSAVWGRSPFYVPETPTAAVEDLLLLHTRYVRFVRVGWVHRGQRLFDPNSLNHALLPCSWVEAAGGALADEEEGVTEVSALVSYCGESLQEVVEGKTFKEAYEVELQVRTGCSVRGTGMLLQLFGLTSQTKNTPYPLH